jgi:hypothetical protein
LPLPALQKLQNDLLIYVTFVMCWGSVVALMDQKLYGHIIAFMVNMMAGSVLYYFDNRKMMVPILLREPDSCGRAAVLYQTQSDILVGHYVNLLVFITISWIASRIVYQNFCSDFKSKKTCFGSSTHVWKKKLRKRSASTRNLSPQTSS